VDIIPEEEIMAHRPINGRGLVGLATLMLAAGLASAVVAQDMKVDPSIGDSLKGKKVLVSPYWLDAFGTASSSWITRMLEPYGIEVDAVNPNGTASKQQDQLSTAIANHTYDVIVWQPVDSQTAGANIKRIQDEKIPQIVQFASPGIDGLNYSLAAIDWKASFSEPGRAAAEFVKKHPELGPVKVAWMGPYPSVQICEDRLAGFMEGVKSVAPDAELVFNGGSTNQEQARSKMTDFITRDEPFNIFAGCGSTEANGGFAAINAGGLGGAKDKVPEHVYMVGEADPAALEMLWNKDSAVMRAGMFGPKTAAEADVKMILDLLTGKVAYDQAVAAPVTMVWFGPNCTEARAAALDQFQGVEGFTVPECSFEYAGND
jgi:ABC-type sugar transport system substrate-binding protein